MKLSHWIKPLLCLIVGLLVMASGNPARAVDPQGNFTGVWKDEKGNDLLITQRGNRQISVKILNDNGSLIWSTAFGQGRKEGVKWVLDMTMRLRTGGTEKRRGIIEVAQGRVMFPKNTWTLVSTPQMQIAELQQRLIAANNTSVQLLAQVNRLQQDLNERNALIAQLQNALAGANANVAQLQAQLQQRENSFRTQMDNLAGSFRNLQDEYTRLLQDKQLSDAQRQQIAEQYETLKAQTQPLVLAAQTVQALAPFNTPLNALRDLFGV